MSDENLNSGGVRGVTIAYDFECFDKLPPTVRRALANANNKYCSVQLFDLYQRKIMTARELIEELRTFERMQANKHLA